MSESDCLTFSRDRARLKGGLADNVEIALSDETEFARQGTLDFVDNALNRSSGTIHARATVPNPDGLLTPGVFARVRLVVGAPVPALLVRLVGGLPKTPRSARRAILAWGAAAQGLNQSTDRLSMG